MISLLPMLLPLLVILLGFNCPAVASALTPVIGILSQPFTNADTNETEFMIAASYVKWLEAAGARSIAIPYDAFDDVDLYFPQINGLLFPGGASLLPQTAWRLWELALDANSAGRYFPVWGTCLGFEYITMMASGKGQAALQGGFDAYNVTLPLELTNYNSQLYNTARLHDVVTSQNVSMNNHLFGISPDAFRQSPDLSAMFHVTSTNQDRKGRPFVSTIEPIQPDLHPFFGVQFHPEKNAFEYGTYPNTNIAYEDINHSRDAIFFSLHLATFFVSLAQRNLAQGIHLYTEPDLFPMVYTYPMRPGIKFQQSYIIPPASNESVVWKRSDDIEAEVLVA